MAVELREHAGQGSTYKAVAGTCTSTVGVHVVHVQMWQRVRWGICMLHTCSCWVLRLVGCTCLRMWCMVATRGSLLHLGSLSHRFTAWWPTNVLDMGHGSGHRSMCSHAFAVMDDAHVLAPGVVASGGAQNM